MLSSHVQLQKEGFLSTWTNSFVGPWDPSQGLHNPGEKWKYGCNMYFSSIGLITFACLTFGNLACPDEKIKLWLFLPGRHSSVVETAQAAVSKLRGMCYS